MLTSLPRQLLAAALALSMLILLVSLQACGDASRKSPLTASPPPRTSAVYTLAPQQTVALGPNASVRLDRVNDSRCQPGKVCVWAGYLSYSLTFHGPSGDASFVLADAMPGVARTVTQQGLTFALENNEEAAVAGAAASAGPAAPDYRVSLRVTIPATRPRDLHDHT